MLLSSGSLEYVKNSETPNNVSLTKEWPLILYTEELPPFNYIDTMGKTVGQSTEVVQELMKRMGVNYPIYLVPWDEGYQNVLSIENTAIYSTIMTRNRESKFKWVGPISKIEFSFFTCSDNPVVITDLDDIRKKGIIAVVRSDAREEYLQVHSFSNLMPLSDEDECIRALSSGKADFWLGTTDLYAQNAKQILWENISTFRRLDLPIMAQNMYIAFHQNTPDEVIQVWQEKLDAMKADGTYDLIQSRYMPYICSWVRCTP